MNTTRNLRKLDMSLAEVLDTAYTLEINIGITSFFDQGYVVSLGDEMNGLTDQSTHNYSSESVASELVKMIIAYYPQYTNKFRFKELKNEK